MSALHNSGEDARGVDGKKELEGKGGGDDDVI